MTRGQKPKTYKIVYLKVGEAPTKVEVMVRNKFHAYLVEDVHGNMDMHTFKVPGRNDEEAIHITAVYREDGTAMYAYVVTDPGCLDGH